MESGTVITFIPPCSKSKGSMPRYSCPAGNMVNCHTPSSICLPFSFSQGYVFPSSPSLTRVQTFSFFFKAFTTTTLLVQICQNDQVQFGFLENTYLGLSQAISAVISTFALWQFQKWRKVTTKKMVSFFFLSTYHYFQNGSLKFAC